MRRARRLSHASARRRQRRFQAFGSRCVTKPVEVFATCPLCRRARLDDIRGPVPLMFKTSATTGRNNEHGLLSGYRLRSLETAAHETMRRSRRSTKLAGNRCCGSTVTSKQIPDRSSIDESSIDEIRTREISCSAYKGPNQGGDGVRRWRSKPRRCLISALGCQRPGRALAVVLLTAGLWQFITITYYPKPDKTLHVS
jgi:hypothetical protein